jgi:dolichyl-phosphate-mannose-protein mannosyltransferase
LIERLRRPEPALAGVVVLIAVCVGLPLASAWDTGSIHVPHDDDWAYARITLTLVRSGHLHLVGWGQMTLLGHIGWGWVAAQLGGASLATLNTATAVWAAGGVLLAYAVARRFATPGRALVAAAVVAVSPAYSDLAVTFMTDTPAFVAALASLALGVTALQRSPPRLTFFAASLAAGVAGFTMRELAVTAPAAVAVAAVAAAPSRMRARVVLLTAVAGAACVGFYVWRHTLPNGDTVPGIAPGSGSTALGLVIRVWFTFAFALLPALAIVAWDRRRRLLRPSVLCSAGLVLAVGLASLHRTSAAPWGLFTGNIFTRLGADPSGVAASGPPPFSHLTWDALTALALVAGAMLAAVVSTLRPVRLAPAELAVALFGAAQLALILFRGLQIGHLYERYLWGPAFAAAVLMLRTPTNAMRARAPMIGAVAATALLGMVGVAVAVNDTSASAARWRAGDLAVASGYPASHVDAGFEWVGYHYPYTVSKWSGPPRAAEPASWYMQELFVRVPNCAIASYLPSSFHEIGRVHYRPLWPRGQSVIHLYRNFRAC